MKAARLLAAALAFGAGVATAVILLGTRDLESYEHVFFSLDRGTRAEVVRVFGQPVHTLALGFGVRLPLQGSVGASPAARLSPYLPAPVTYWLLLTLSIGAAVLVVRHALEPLCGGLASWLAIVLLFWSVPMVNYTVSDDWVETAVTYIASVACVFAPHGLLAVLDSRRSAAMRRIGGVSLTVTVWALIAASHAGHWPILAAALVSTSACTLCRPDHPFRTRLTAVMVLAAASLMAVVPQVPDILRELQAARASGPGEMTRILEGARGGLLSANLLPLAPVDSRLPFTYLLLALVSLVVGLTSERVLLRGLAVWSSVLSIMLGVAASTLPAGTSTYSPTFSWLLRDPAAAFAVFSAACAAAALRASRHAHRVMNTGLAAVALILAALLGPAYAASLVLRETAVPLSRRPWTQDMTAPAERASRRGLDGDRLASGKRLALWPRVRGMMRNDKQPGTDFADAGYLLVSAWTKQRTMRGLIAPNEYLFNQEIELSTDVLCNANAVHFLQLRYLLRPADVAACAPWALAPNLLVDGWLEVDLAQGADDRIRALPVARLTEPLTQRPALSAGSELLPALVPLPGTSLTIEAPDIVLWLDDLSIARGHALMLPVAYDTALHASSGETRNVGGLLALVGVDQRQVRVEFVPDFVAVLRAVSMTLAQVLALAGLLGLAYVGRVEPHDSLLRRLGMRWIARAVPLVPPPRDWLYVAYSIALGWRLMPLLLPITALIVARLAQREQWHRWGGTVLLTAALLGVAAGGSRAAAAPHDPLFWGLMAAVALGVSAVTGRWPAAASTASAVAGAFSAVAVLLPAFPDFESSFPAANLTTVRESFRALSGQLGPLATTCLLGLWLQAIVLRGNRSGNGARMDAAARGALLAALLLTMLGAVPAGIDAGWMVALGLVLGLAEANARQQR